MPSKESRTKGTFDTIQGEQGAVQQAANVPGMPQFNNLRSEVRAGEASDLIADAAEVQARTDADAQNAANDAAAIVAQKTRDDAQDAAGAGQVARVDTIATGLQNAIIANSNADAATKTAQTATDAKQTTDIAANATTDASRATTQATTDAGQNTAIATETTRAKAVEQTNADADASRATTQTQTDAGQNALIAGIPTLERFTGTSTGTSTFAVTFGGKPYKAAPFVIPVTVIVGDMAYFAKASSITTTGCTLQIEATRGTLLLSNSPLQQAAAGSAYEIYVYGSRTT